MGNGGLGEGEEDMVGEQGGDGHWASHLSHSVPRPMLLFSVYEEQLFPLRGL